MAKNITTNVKAIIFSLIIPIIIISLWELAIRTGYFPNSLIATPTQVMKNLFVMLFDLEIVGHAWASLKRLFLGFTLGVSLGVSLGVLVGYSRLGARLLEPTLLALIPVPPIAWIPLLIIFFGIGEASKIGLIAIGGFVTLFLQTAFGVRSTSKDIMEVAYVYKKNFISILFKILLPSALPNIFSSMRVAMALSWTLLMASEMIASSKGLGWLIWDSRNFSRPDDMIVGMIVVGILGKATDYLIVILEKRYSKWRVTLRDI